MDNQLINELKEASFQLWSSTPLRSLAERIRNTVADYDENVVVRCPQCQRLYALPSGVSGLWCVECVRANPHANAVWISKDSTVSDDVAREFLVGRMWNDLKEVVREFETVVNSIGRLRELVGRIAGDNTNER